MAIETDDDLDGLMLDSGETLTLGGTGYTVLASEVDGETLDSGPDEVDGHIEVLIKASDIAAGSVSEGDPATYSGDTYRISKIDPIGGGLSVVYLEP